MNNPTLWMVNHYALTPGNSGGTRHYALAKHLATLGWDSVIFAASTELNTCHQRLTPGEYTRYEMVEGVPFFWLRAPKYSGNRWGRLFNMLVFSTRLLRHARDKHLPRPAAILGSSPHPFSALAAWWIARRMKVPFFYEIRDLWPLQLVQVGAINACHPLMRLFGMIERFLARRASRVITLLPNIALYFEEQGLDTSKLVWIPNGIDADLFATAPAAPERTPFTFMYFGAHGTANGLDNLLHAMKHLQDGADNPPIRLRLIGDGPYKPHLVKLAQELGLRDVTFEAPVPKQSIPALAAEADGFVFNLTDAAAFNDYGISSNKLFDFMASARPVIFSCHAGNNPIAAANAGLSIAPDHPDILAQTMRELATTPLPERQAMGERGRAYVIANHSFANLAAKLRDTAEQATHEVARKPIPHRRGGKLIQLFKQLYGSSFIRNATVLTTGSFIAQLIPLLFLPMLTRMYGPMIFGVQALLQTGAAFLAPLASGQYEWAIPTPRLKRRAQGIATVAIAMALMVCCITFFVILLLREPILDLFKIHAVGDWIYTYPFLALGVALMNVANYWLLRRGKFMIQSLNKLVAAVSTALIGVFAGLAGITDGLLIGFLGGLIIGAIWSQFQAHRHGLRLVTHEKRDYLVGIAKEYRQFPLYGGLPSAINNFAMQIPLLIIAASYSLDVTGHYAVARNILNGGVTLLAVCVGQVILKHMAERVAAGQRIWPEYCKILGGLIAFGLCMAAGVYVIGPKFFTLYLGEDWSESADITRIFSLNVVFWFVGITAAQVAVAIQKMRVIALWQVMYGTLACSLFLFSHLPFTAFLHHIVVLEIISYTLYTLFVTAVIWRHDRREHPRLAA